MGKHAGTKEGHYIVGEKGDCPGGDGDSNDRSSNDVWHEIILARTRQEFFDIASRLAPRQLACSFNSLVAYADWKYRPEVEEYVSPPGEFVVPEELSDWVDQNVRGPIGMLFDCVGPNMFLAWGVWAGALPFARVSRPGRTAPTCKCRPRARYKIC